MKTAAAPGKIILLGEHSALYGNPALVVTTDLRDYVTVSARKDNKINIKGPWIKEAGSEQIYKKGEVMVHKAVELCGGGGFDIELKSNVPLASGMGSSAAIASALVAAISAEKRLGFEKDKIAEIAWGCEDTVHGKSSGVDPYASTYGGVLLYQKGSIKKINPKELPEIVVAHSGLAKDTGGLVFELDNVWESDPERLKGFLRDSKEIVTRGAEAIKASDWEALGRLMYENHKLLAKIGVSCRALDTLVEAARTAGAYGAKLSGAGKGGIMIALVDKKSKKRVSEGLSKAGGKIIGARISEEGVRLE